MRISVTQTFSRSRARGFTLLEILVVLTIAAVLTGSIVLGFNGAGEGQRLQGEAERLVLRMELARSRALQRNREIGFHMDPVSYEFSERDRESGEWITLTERPFSAVALAEGDNLRVKVEGEEGDSVGRADAKALAALDDLADGDSGLDGGGLSDTDAKGAGEGQKAQSLPELVFFRSGEVTPFTVTFESEDVGIAWVLTCDGLGAVTLARGDDLT
jgi:type II secretion system protein H